jgi:hypothetical protein
VTEIVIPGADEFGTRVNHRTPLAQVVAVLRRHNPRADYRELRSTAEALRRNGHPFPNGDFVPLSDEASDLLRHLTREREPEVSRDRTPDRFDSGADSGAVPSAVVDADARAPESVVGVVETATPGERKPTRAEVEAWLATQPKRNRPVMSKSGRIPAATLAAYRAAHRDEVLAEMVPVEGGEPMPAEVPPTEIY